MKYIYILILSVVLISCDDFLSVTPKGVVSPNTVEEFDLMLASPSGYLGDETLYSDPDIFLTDDYLLGLSPYAERIYQWADYFYLPDETSDSWVSPYSEIYSCNLILEKIDAAASKYDDEILRSTVKGEALARRATAYFFLVNQFGKHYDANTAQTDLGVPLVLHKTITPGLPRATVKKVYDQIEKDLLLALGLVSEYPDMNVRVGKDAVNAILAKVYLYKGDFKKAEDYSIKALGDNPFLYDYKEESLTMPDNPWMGTSLPTIEVDFEEIIFSNSLEYYFDSSPSIYYSQSLLNIFDQENDLRFAYFSTGVNKLDLPLDGIAYVADIPRSSIATIPEMLLIKAEAMIRNDKVDEGISLVNTLRENRFAEGADYTLFANSKEEALNLVVDEYRREFAFTGLNWMNLKRLRSQGYKLPTYSRTARGETFTLSPESNKFVFPIPRREIEMNSLLKQNPR